MISDPLLQHPVILANVGWPSALCGVTFAYGFGGIVGGDGRNAIVFLLDDRNHVG